MPRRAAAGSAPRRSAPVLYPEGVRRLATAVMSERWMLHTVRTPCARRGETVPHATERRPGLLGDARGTLETDAVWQRVSLPSARCLSAGMGEPRMRLQQPSAPLNRAHPLHMGTRCKRCGGPCEETRETLPFVGPGPLAVQLEGVEGWRCAWCGHGYVRVPELRQLNSVVRELAREELTDTPRLTFESGTWRVQPN
jgi:hypothetical protein